MKTLNVIVFANKNEEIKYTTAICEKFANSNLSPDQLFCGVWGEITHNRNECVNSIVSTINHFLNSTKNEIFFGCSEKDFDEILSLVNTNNCNVKIVNCSTL